MRGIIPQNDHLKDMAIEEFLNTPIDSRSSSTDPNFSKPSSNFSTNKIKKKKEKTEKEIMDNWGRTISRISKKCIISTKVKNKDSTDHSSIIERSLTKKQIQDRPVSEKNSTFMFDNPVPLRKNEIPIGRRLPNDLIFKRSKRLYE